MRDPSILQPPNRSANRTTCLLRRLNSGPRHSHAHPIRTQNSLPYEICHGKNQSRPTETTDHSKAGNTSSCLLIPVTKSIHQKHDPAISKITHWTDSTVVLHWIYNINDRQKTYIVNRLHEIRHTTAIGTDKGTQPTKEPEESRQQNSSTHIG